jgi:hypothetical protein
VLEGGAVLDQPPEELGEGVHLQYEVMRILHELYWLSVVVQECVLSIVGTMTSFSTRIVSCTMNRLHACTCGVWGKRCMGYEVHTSCCTHLVNDGEGEGDGAQNH